MEIEVIRKMQDLTFELEGLLGLAADREELREILSVHIANKLRAIQEVYESESSELSELTDTPEQKQLSEHPDPAQLDEPEESAEVSERSEPTEQEESPEREEAEDETSEQEESPGREEAEEESEVFVHEETKERSEPARVVKPVFSINDKFLFSRELFGGSTADFERALKEMAACESYEEAEDYFYTEWNLDPDDPMVVDFMMIISKYF